MTTVNGAYTEGVCQYSYMSLRSSLTIAAVYAQAFGQVWPSIDIAKVGRMSKWHLDSYDTTGKSISRYLT